MIAGGSLTKEFLLQMVQTMYKFESRLFHMERVLNDDELQDFYHSYIGGPLEYNRSDTCFY